MADLRSGEGGRRTSSRKRKLVSTSDTGSLDSTFSPTGKKYKLRATTSSGCVFAGCGKPLSKSASSSTSTTSSRVKKGPSTSYWGPAQTNRLNFKRPTPIQFSLDNSREENIIRFLLGPLESPDSEVVGPSIATPAMEEKLIQECTDDPSKKYMKGLIHGLKENGVRLLHPNKEHITDVETYLYQKLEVEQKNKKVIFSETVLNEMYDCIYDIYHACSTDKKTEWVLDDVIVRVMKVAQMQVNPVLFRISQVVSTTRIFDICGSQVTSITNVLWETCPQLKRHTAERVPIIMVENKSSGNVEEKSSKQTVYPVSMTSHAHHKKISQVIGQCVSIADKSAFETKDDKIVYHVSLMGTSKLVITRTHVAKSTLKVIKDGCPIPDQNDLDPSYVFETCFLISNNVEEAFDSLYTTLLIFAKLAYMSFCSKPIDQSKKATVRCLRDKLKGAFRSKPSDKRPSKKQ